MGHNKKISVWQFLALGYLLLIIVGSILLYLPVSTKNGESTTYLNALFTSTSASCVTGLLTYDTATHWSTFGQIVILCLIQIGGLGFMTFISLGVLMIRRRMGIFQTKILMQSAGEFKMSNLHSLLKRIIAVTFILEFAGFILLSTVFVPDFGLKGLYLSLWHAISAYCNAGFDLFGGLFGGTKYVSLTPYATNPVVVLTICALIILGGTGFLVWNDLWQNKFKFKKLNLHSKIVLIANAVLITLTVGLFYLTEFNNPELAKYNTWEKFLIAIFNAITPRTAGFNTMDTSKLSNSGYLLSVITMCLGGNSGSTAGGIKINTFIILVFSIKAIFQNKQDVEIGSKRIKKEVVHQALVFTLTYIFLLLIAVFTISILEKNNEYASFQAVLYEVSSALATVGLSFSVPGATFTTTLTSSSKCILILLMYLGRAGILTLVLALGNHKKTEFKKPVDNMLVG